jgi:antitoxin HicB
VTVADNKKYPAQVFYSEEDGGYIALAPDLPGCSAFGETQEEALRELQDAISVWKGAAGKAGNPIPEPSQLRPDPLPSGKVLLRCPRSLHAQLIERAKRDDVSLNQYIITALSGVSAAHTAVEMAAQSMRASIAIAQESAATVARDMRSVSAARLAAEMAGVGDALRAVEWHSVRSQILSSRGVQIVDLASSEQYDLRKLPAGRPVILEKTGG